MSKSKRGTSKDEKKGELKNVEDEPIKFYRPNNAYGHFSNFFPSPFKVDGKLYKTNEHYFQSKKYQGHPQQQLVIDAATPSEAFKFGRNKAFPRRADWETIKEKIMYDGLLLKFKTHKDLLEKLAETGDKQLIEHTHKDKYWADGGDGSGKNRLGVLLMKVRSQLLKKDK